VVCGVIMYTSGWMFYSAIRKDPEPAS